MRKKNEKKQESLIKEEKKVNLFLYERPFCMSEQICGVERLKLSTSKITILCFVIEQTKTNKQKNEANEYTRKENAVNNRLFIHHCDFTKPQFGCY